MHSECDAPPALAAVQRRLLRLRPRPPRHSTASLACGLHSRHVTWRNSRMGSRRSSRRGVGSRRCGAALLLQHLARVLQGRKGAVTKPLLQPPRSPAAGAHPARKAAPPHGKAAAACGPAACPLLLPAPPLPLPPSLALPSRLLPPWPWLLLLPLPWPWLPPPLPCPCACPWLGAPCPLPPCPPSPPLPPGGRLEGPSLPCCTPLAPPRRRS